MATSVDLHSKLIRIIDTAVPSKSGYPTTEASDVKITSLAANSDVISDLVLNRKVTSTTAGTAGNDIDYSGFDVKHGTSTASLHVGFKNISGTHTAVATAPSTPSSAEGTEIVTADWIKAGNGKTVKEEVLTATLTAGTSYAVGGTYTVGGNNLEVYLDGVLCQKTTTYAEVTGGAAITFVDTLPIGMRITIIIR